MDIFILTSKILGVYLVVSGLFLIFKAKSIPVLLKDFFDHPAIIYLTGIILIFLSTMYLIQYNIWNYSWRTIITIFAWLVLLKGLSYVFLPKALSEISIKRYHSWFSLWGIVAILIGVYLFYLG